MFATSARRKTMGGVAAVTTTLLLALGGVPSWAGSAPTIKGVSVTVYGPNANEIKDLTQVYVATVGNTRTVTVTVDGHSKVMYLSRRAGQKVWHGHATYKGLSRQAHFYITVKACGTGGCTIKRQRRHA